jgi:hypothetical protein
MVNRRNLRGLISGVAAMLFVSATAMANTISLPYAGTLGGKQVAAGHYKITWEHHSPTATVTLADGRKLVATAEGKVEERSTKFARNMVVYTTQSDGSQVITEIRLGGTNTAIVFTP